MVREVVVNCDICGDPGAKTYTITVEGMTREIDLDEKHRNTTLAKVWDRAREVTADAPARQGGMRSLDSRVRGVPAIG